MPAAARHCLARFAFLALLLLTPAATDAASPAVGPRPKPVTLRRSAEELALLAIQDDAVRRVQALVDRMRRMPDGPAREALEREAVEIKQHSELQLLRTQAEFARARGNLAVVREIELLIAQRLAPGPVQTGPVSAKPVEKGGAR